MEKENNTSCIAYKAVTESFMSMTRFVFKWYQWTSLFISRTDHSILSIDMDSDAQSRGL